MRCKVLYVWFILFITVFLFVLFSPALFSDQSWRELKFDKAQTLKNPNLGLRKGEGMRGEKEKRYRSGIKQKKKKKRKNFHL